MEKGKEKVEMKMKETKVKRGRVGSKQVWGMEGKKETTKEVKRDKMWNGAAETQQ